LTFEIPRARRGTALPFVGKTAPSPFPAGLSTFGDNFPQKRGAWYRLAVRPRISDLAFVDVPISPFYRHREPAARKSQFPAGLSTFDKPVSRSAEREREGERERGVIERHGREMRVRGEQEERGRIDRR